MDVTTETPARRKRRARTIADRLARTYPDAGAALQMRNPFEVLIATILSAQTTDAAVNEVTPQLFSTYPDAASLAQADPEAIEPVISRIGLHRTKARNIVAAARTLQEDFGGEVPETMEALTSLPGVGRKTANCVFVNGFGKPGLMTDTHFCRIMRRTGLSAHKEPAKIEADIAELLPPKRWGDFSHQVIRHGRVCCTARKPHCAKCVLLDICPAGQERTAEETTG
jgi:endonuclease-3